MTVTANYMRYYAPGSYECDTVEEAFEFLAYQEAEGNVSRVSVVDGETVYERDTPEFERLFDLAWKALG